MTRAAIVAELEDDEGTRVARREARRMAVWCHNTRQPAASWMQLDAIQRLEFERVAEEYEAKAKAKTKTPRRR